jgi:hypothetical protein
VLVYPISPLASLLATVARDFTRNDAIHGIAYIKANTASVSPISLLNATYVDHDQSPSGMDWVSLLTASNLPNFFETKSGQDNVAYY